MGRFLTRKTYTTARAMRTHHVYVPDFVCKYCGYREE